MPHRTGTICRMPTFPRSKAAMCQICMLLAALVFGSIAARAQDGKTIPIAPDHPYTLHVYEDLVQVPSLVLNPLHASYRGLTAANFFISLDSGPKFHPKHIRLEGDDPISVTLLLDDSDVVKNPQVRALDGAVSHLPLNLFGPQDRVSVFAFDCTLVRSVFNEPASYSMLQAGISSVLTSPSLHGTPAGQPCKKRFGLWDAVGVVVRATHELPGRRVIVILSQGIDYGSAANWEAVRQYAAFYSTALIGLRPPADPKSFPAGPLPPGARLLDRAEDPFGMLCDGSGGLSLVTSTEALTATLHSSIDLLRSRYILEFPRPTNGTAGQHEMVVSVTDKTAIVHTSGTSVPVQDKALLNDPSTVPTDTTQSPRMGSRRILAPHAPH